jgi:hypothetical protein
VPLIAGGLEKEIDLLRQERELAASYDAWTASEARTMLMGTGSDEASQQARSKEIVGGLLELMRRQDPERVGAALSKMGESMLDAYKAEIRKLRRDQTGGERAPVSALGDAMLRDYVGRINKGEMTLAEAAADFLAGQRAASLNERRKVKLPAQKAFDELRTRLRQDLEARGGLAGEAAKRQRIEKAIETLAANDYLLEEFFALGQRHGNEAEEARKAFARELITDMIPRYTDDENVRELHGELRDGVRELAAKGGLNPEQRGQWEALLIEATAEDLRRLVAETKRDMREGGITIGDALTRLLEGLMRDVRDPAALKEKKKRK